MIAENDDVWNLINSDLTEKSKNLSKSQTLAYQKSRDANIDFETYSQ